MPNNKNGKKSKKKSAPGFFSRWNTNKAYEHDANTIVTNPKSKLVKWMFVGTIATATIVGISVPWALSSCEAKVKIPLKNDNVMYTYIDPVTNKIVSVTWEEFEKRVNEYSPSQQNQEVKELNEMFNLSVITKLYDEEQKAFFEFKAIIGDMTNKSVGNDTYGYDVSKTSDDIKNEQRKILEKNKRQFQQSLGNNWIDKWISELKTNPIYGLQNLENATAEQLPLIENKAVEFMKVSVIKKPALARFEKAEINTDQWVQSNLKWNNLNQIKYKDENGQDVTIESNTARSKLEQFLKTDNTASLTNPSVYEQNKLAVFQTKSYVWKHRNPNELLKSILPKHFNTATVSVLDLAIKPGEKNLSPFTFENSVLENLFKITNNLNVSNFAAITRLSNFKGAVLDATPDDNKKDKQLMKNVIGGEEETEAIKKMGSSQNKILSDLLVSGENDTNRIVNLVAVSSDGQNYISSSNGGQINKDDFQIYNAKQDDVFTKFLDLLLSITGPGNVQPNFNSDTTKKSYWEGMGKRNVSPELWNFIQLIKNNFEKTTNNNSQYAVKSIIETDYNNKLTNYITAFKEDDKAYIGALISVILMDDKAKINYLSENSSVLSNTVGFWSLYKLGANSKTFLHVNKEGMKIFSKEIITNISVKANLKKMIKNDLERSLDTDDAKNLLYDLPSIYEKMNNDYIINGFLLSDISNADLFKNEIKRQYPDQSEEKFNKFNEQIQLNLASLYGSNEKLALEKIDEVIKGFVDEKKYYEFATIQDSSLVNSVYWQADPIKPYETSNTSNNKGPIGYNNVLSEFIRKYLNILRPVNISTK